MDKNTKFIIIILIGAILFTIAQLTKSATLFAITMPIVMVAWLFAGAAKKGKVAKRQSIYWIASLVIMIGSLLVMLDMVKVPENIIKSHFLGFPLPTAVLFFVFWIGLAFVSTLSYCVRFDKDHLKDEWIKEFEDKTGTKILHTVAKGEKAYESSINE